MGVHAHSSERSAVRARQGQDRLDSWKEIASYLNRDVRTAQRWEEKAGLPVHRLASGRRRPVFAYRAELDAWLREQPADTPVSQLETPDAAPVRRITVHWMIPPVILLLAAIVWVVAHIIA